MAIKQDKDQSATKFVKSKVGFVFHRRGAEVTEGRREFELGKT